MAGDNGKMFTAEESLRAINDKSKEGDNFVVKVSRRAHLGAMPSLVATLSSAEVQHFTSPELWLPNLCGGGKFILQAYHVSDLNRPVAGAMQFQVDNVEAHDVDPSALKKADWRGPHTLEFPNVTARPQSEQDLGPLYAIQSPSAPGSSDSANRTTQGWPRQAGGGSIRQDYVGASVDPRQAALEGERRSLETIRLDLEKDKHRAELASIKKDHEADLRAMESKIMGAISQARPAGPDPMVVMLMEMTKQAAEDRRVQQQMMAEDRRVAETRAAEDRKVERERQERADARFMDMMKEFSKSKENPIETFKVFSELMGSKKDNGIIEAQTKMMHSMSEMMGQQVSTAMDFVNAAADLQLGGQRNEEEPGWLKGVDRLIKGVGAMAKARAPVAGPPQLAAAAPVPQQAPPQQQPPQQAKSPDAQKSIVVQIEEGIRAKLPVVDIAKALIHYVNEPSVQEVLVKSGFDFEKAFHDRLGNWHNEAPSNAEYLTALFAEVEKQAIAAGLIAGDSPTSVEPEEVEEEEEADAPEGDDE